MSLKSTLRLLREIRYDVPSYPWPDPTNAKIERLEKELRCIKRCGTCKRFANHYCEDTTWAMDANAPINGACKAQEAGFSEGWTPLDWEYASDESNYMPEDQTQRFEITRLRVLHTRSIA